jgi:hypothetical protein
MNGKSKINRWLLTIHVPSFLGMLSGFVSFGLSCVFSFGGLFFPVCWFFSGGEVCFGCSCFFKGGSLAGAGVTPEWDGGVTGF